MYRIAVYRNVVSAVAALAISAVVGFHPAMAAPITITDTTPRYLDSTPINLPLTIPAGFGFGSLSWYQDLSFDGWTPGDTINSATLDLVFSDKNGNETLVVFTDLVFPGGTASNIPNNGGIQGLDVSLNPIEDAALQLTGDLGVTIDWTATRFTTAFILDSATLTVNGDTPSVPEPASFALLGTALAGCGLMRRRKRA